MSEHYTSSPPSRVPAQVTDQQAVFLPHRGQGLEKSLYQCIKPTKEIPLVRQWANGEFRDEIQEKMDNLADLDHIPAEIEDRIKTANGDMNGVQNDAGTTNENTTTTDRQEALPA